MLQSGRSPVIPLWIKGHASLTATPAFLDVRNPNSGEVLRRTPLCGVREALIALEAAEVAALQWSSRSILERRPLLVALSEALSDYANHFAELIAEESGKPTMLARTEVNDSVLFFRDAVADSESGVLGVVGDARMPLLAALQHAVPALAGGAAVIVRPSPDTPSALLALAELTARSGFPPGVFSILHGGVAAVDALCSLSGVRVLYAGEVCSACCACV